MFIRIRLDLERIRTDNNCSIFRPNIGLNLIRYLVGNHLICDKINSHKLKIIWTNFYTDQTTPIKIWSYTLRSPPIIQTHVCMKMRNAHKILLLSIITMRYVFHTNCRHPTFTASHLVVTAKFLKKKKTFTASLYSRYDQRIQGRTELKQLLSWIYIYTTVIWAFSKHFNTILTYVAHFTCIDETFKKFRCLVFHGNRTWSYI